MVAERLRGHGAGADRRGAGREELVGPQAGAPGDRGLDVTLRHEVREEVRARPERLGALRGDLDGLGGGGVEQDPCGRLADLVLAALGGERGTVGDEPTDDDRNSGEDRDHGTAVPELAEDRDGGFHSSASNAPRGPFLLRGCARAYGARTSAEGTGATSVGPACIRSRTPARWCAAAAGCSHRDHSEPMVGRTVVLLGLTSLLTDISSEMVVTVLPLYLVYVGGFSPLAFGLIDGIYNGATAIVRLGERVRRRPVAAPQGGRRDRVRPLGALQARSCSRSAPPCRRSAPSCCSTARARASAPRRATR